MPVYTPPSLASKNDEFFLEEIEVLTSLLDGESRRDLRDMVEAVARVTMRIVSDTN